MSDGRTPLASALDVPMHLRIDRELDQQLRQRASDEHIPTSALVRRLLRQAIQQGSAALSPADVEDIARRVARKSSRATDSETAREPTLHHPKVRLGSETDVHQNIAVIITHRNPIMSEDFLLEGKHSAPARGVSSGVGSSW